MKWLPVALCLAACSSEPYVIGRYVPVDDDAAMPGFDAGVEAQDAGSDEGDECEDDYANALVCSGFEEPLEDEWSELVETRRGSLGRSRDVVFEGEHALHAETEASSSSAVVVQRFPALDGGHVYMRAMMYIPSGLPTNIMNLFFLGDDANMDADFEGIDLNVVEGVLQVFAPQADPTRSTGTHDLPRDSWFCLRMDVTLDHDEGTVDLYVDDELDLAAVGLDTLPARGTRQFRAGIDWSSEQEDYFEVFVDSVVLDVEPVFCP